MNRFITLLLFAAISWAYAALKAPDFTVHEDQSSVGKTVALIAESPKGHHFNTDAPMSLLWDGKSFKPKSSSPARIRFELPASAKKAKLRIALYLCDDAKTFCEKHELDYAAGAAAASAAANGPTSEAPTKTARMQKHGFYLNAPDAAFEEAKRENKPLLIDFFGIWCPPCNELDEKVFSSKDFSTAAKRFVRLKLDADAPVSWNLKSKYQIGGYPTIVFASSDGDEISRIVGFRARRDFVASMDDAWNHRDSALQSLQAQAQAGNRDAADRAGVILYERGDHAAAAKLLSGTKACREYWHMAEIDSLQDAGAPDEKQVSRIQQALAEFPKTPNSVDWYGKLAELQGNQKNESDRKASLEKAIQLAKDLSAAIEKNPEDYKSYDATAADLLESEADYREQLLGPERKSEARADWLAAAEAYRKRGIGPTERGNNLEYAFCLWKAGEYDQARSIYTRLEHVYPEEFTFFYNHGRMEKEANQPQRAFELFTKALDRSYGDNRLRVAKSAAETADQLGKRERARQIADQALAHLELPADAHVRTHRYAEQLRKFRKTLD